MVNLTSDLVSMEILPSPGQSSKADDKPRKRKRNLKVRFDVPDEDLNILVSERKKRKKSPSPTRETVKKERKQRKKRRFSLAVVGKSLKRRHGPIKKAAVHLLKVKKSVKPSQTKSRDLAGSFESDLSSLVFNKNNNCSTSNSKGTKTANKPNKHVSGKHRKSKHLAKLYKMKKRSSNSRLVRVKPRAGMRNLSSVRGKRQIPRPLSKAVKSQEAPKPETSSCSHCSATGISGKRRHAKLKNSKKNKNKASAAAKALRKARKDKAMAFRRKIKYQLQRSARRRLEMKRKLQKKRKNERKALLLEIEQERIEFERSQRGTLNIKPIERNEDYDVIPALRVKFLKYITFKEAIAHHQNCCEKCCWDRWSEVDAEDIEEDYN